MDIVAAPVVQETCRGSPVIIAACGREARGKEKKEEEKSWSNEGTKSGNLFAFCR